MDCCAHGTLCFELAKGIPAAFVTLIIGAIAAYIAWRQHETAKAKLKLDLFDKRYEIFEETWSYLSQAAKLAQNPDPFHPFTNIIPRAGFLFGSDIEKYLRTASEKQTQLWSINAKSKSNNNIIAPEDIDRLALLESWFFNEASIGAKQVFGSYLNFEEWK
jgi:hypothetical protein